MRIRAAEHRDLNDIARVQTVCWQDSFQDYVPAHYLEHRLHHDLRRQWQDKTIEPGDVVLVAEDGEMVGFIAIWCRPDPYIDNLYVLRERRSDGLGARLMAEAAIRLMDRGQSTAYLWVLDGNQAAIRFYERLGGVATERQEQSRFGHRGIVVRYAWDDLSVIVNAVKKLEAALPLA